MLLEKRIIAFVKLGEVLSRASQVLEEGDIQQKPSLLHDPLEKLSYAIQQAKKHNGWFTEENIRIALASLGQMLREEKIRRWLKNYPGAYQNSLTNSRVGVIMAGNIPLVGFHDFLCVLMSGHTFVGKLSSDDAFLLPAVSDILIYLEPEFKKFIHFMKIEGSRFQVQRSSNQPGTKSKKQEMAVDAFIATGSNNSARYFEYYFRKQPYIIRKNRNAVAVLDGHETKADLTNLGKDIFQYFGLGCRNVSKIYIPKDYNLDSFYSAIVDFGEVIHHNKYYNNHQYYRTIYLLNNETFLDNNFLMVKESVQIASPVATLYYERYKDSKDLSKKIQENEENIQCIVSNLKPPILRLTSIPFGHTQSPELWDYADGVDTMNFLLKLK